MTRKYPEKVPYILSKSNLEGRLIQIHRNSTPILGRIIEVKKDGDRMGNRTVLIKHVLENNTELILAKHLRSVSHKQEFNITTRQFDTRSGWKIEDNISEDEKMYSNTGKIIDRFVEKTAVVINPKEHELYTNIFHR